MCWNRSCAETGNTPARLRPNRPSWTTYLIRRAVQEKEERGRTHGEGATESWMSGLGLELALLLLPPTSSSVILFRGICGMGGPSPMCATSSSRAGALSSGTRNDTQTRCPTISTKRMSLKGVRCHSRTYPRVLPATVPTRLTGATVANETQRQVRMRHARIVSNGS